LQAREELRACEAHLAAKELELEGFRVSIAREGLGAGPGANWARKVFGRCRVLMFQVQTVKVCCYAVFSFFSNHLFTSVMRTHPIPDFQNHYRRHFHRIRPPRQPPFPNKSLDLLPRYLSMSHRAYPTLLTFPPSRFFKVLRNSTMGPPVGLAKKAWFLIVLASMVIKR
jgi:hypothetical protein